MYCIEHLEDDFVAFVERRDMRSEIPSCMSLNFASVISDAAMDLSDRLVLAMSCHMCSLSVESISGRSPVREVVDALRACDAWSWQFVV